MKPDDRVCLEKLSTISRSNAGLCVTHAEHTMFRSEEIEPYVSKGMCMACEAQSEDALSYQCFWCGAFWHSTCFEEFWDQEGHGEMFDPDRHVLLCGQCLSTRFADTQLLVGHGGVEAERVYAMPPTEEQKRCLRWLEKTYRAAQLAVAETEKGAETSQLTHLLWTTVPGVQSTPRTPKSRGRLGAVRTPRRGL